MRERYDYKNCESLFGYAFKVHQRCQGVCQLCGCNAGRPINFDLWRQMTVEHLIGQSQGGYRRQIRALLGQRFPQLSSAQQDQLTLQIDEANTVTACTFCNATTSRDIGSKTMSDLILASAGSPDDVITAIQAELKVVLERKRADVRWKLSSVREAFERLVIPGLLASRPDIEQ